MYEKVTQTTAGAFNGGAMEREPISKNHVSSRKTTGVGRNFMTAVLIALCVGMGFAGCSEDTLDSLEGTTWVCAVSDGSLSETFTLEFKSENEGHCTWITIYGKEVSSYSHGFTYTYKSLNIVIPEFGATGVVSGNKMTFTKGEWVESNATVFKRK
jgi:hypothetical protein